MADLTKAEIKALVETLAGHVERTYTAKGNTLRGPRGVSSAILWRLIGKRLIDDGPSKNGIFATHCKMILTQAGRDALGMR